MADNPHNWPRFWSGFFEGTAAILATWAAAAWFVILPTVGLLYAFGVLP